MIAYVISTNTQIRPEWSKFAYEQYCKFPGARLVVMDNATDKPSEYWKNLDCDYFHLPECSNVCQMYNWLAKNYPVVCDIFYMDDDIEISSSLVESLKWLKMGWDFIYFSKLYITSLKQNKSCIWPRKLWNLGSVWIASHSIWRDVTFDEATIDGMYKMHQAIAGNVSIKFEHQIFANCMIHDKNLVMRDKAFNFNLDKVVLE